MTSSPTPGLRVSLTAATLTFTLACCFAATLRVHSQSPQESPTPPAAPPPALTGEQLFRNTGCTYCHQFNGEGGRKGPNLSGVGLRLTREAIHRQIAEGGGAMPAFQDALTPAEIDTLTAFLHQARKK